MSAEPIVIAEKRVRELAARYKVPAEVMCTRCGRPAYAAEHHGHDVLRLPRPRREPLTSVAPHRKPSTPPRIEWVSVWDAARELGVSKMTVYRLIHAGELPAHRIGRSFRIKRTALDAYVAGALVVEA